MKTLILGGIKSGKSRLAEAMAEKTTLPVVLIATANASDKEMAQRIKKHQQSRPEDWRTIEEPIHLAQTLNALSDAEHCVVVDCLTLWLTNLLLQRDEKKLPNQLHDFFLAVQSFAGPLILVSNETSMGIVPLGELTRRYCDEAGLLHQTLAAQCDNVILTVAGLPQALKGQCYA